MPDISMCGSTECPSRDTCYRATAIRSEHQSWRDFEATRNGRERCDSYIERGFIEICTLNSEQHIVPCECGHGKDQHNSLDSRPFGKWNCTYCRCVEYDAVTDEPFSGGLGDEATQRAWMRYANEQGVPHDHEDEEAFKYGFDAGRHLATGKAKLEIAEEIENHSYLAGTHEICVWIDSLTKRLREEAKEKNVTP